MDKSSKFMIGVADCCLCGGTWLLISIKNENFESPDAFILSLELIVASWGFDLRLSLIVLK